MTRSAESTPANILVLDIIINWCGTNSNSPQQPACREVNKGFTIVGYLLYQVHLWNKQLWNQSREFFPKNPSSDIMLKQQIGSEQRARSSSCEGYN